MYCTRSLAFDLKKKEYDLILHLEKIHNINFMKFFLLKTRSSTYNENELKIGKFVYLA